MIAIIITFLLVITNVFPDNINYIIINVVVWISTVFTLLSGADYILKSKDLLVLK